MKKTNEPVKKRLLNASLSVIREKGYHATTVDDLCEKAEVTKGAFFHHFKSKEDLAVQAAEHWNTVTSVFFENAPYQKLEDPLDRVLGYVDFRRDILRGEVSEYTCLAGTLVQETYESNPLIRDACQKTIFEHSHKVASDIERAKAIYATGASWDSEELALHIQAVLQGSFILAKAKYNADIAVASIGHLRTYLKLLFNQPLQQPSLMAKKGKS